MLQVHPKIGNRPGEYAIIQSPKLKIHQHNQPFTLECGETLPSLEIGYTTHGTLSPAKDNVVWIFHALTANADPLEWWPGLVGENHVINPDQHFIVCANMLGSCYGSTGPDTINPNTGEKYGLDFPTVTVKDMVKAHEILRAVLGIEKIHLGIGGSMGGQQLVEWAVSNPSVFEKICPIATNAKHSAWGIAFNTTQRMAMEADATLHDKTPQAGIKGLQAARAIAMLSYRQQETYKATQTDDEQKLDGFKASSYQYYQGEKLSKRFTPHAYWYLSKAMDSHNIGRGRGTEIQALNQITARALVLSIGSDLLFPPSEQEFIASHIPNGQYQSVDSLYGHDGFLIETAAITRHLETFLNRQ